MKTIRSFLLCLGLVSSLGYGAADKKIVLIAGGPSHGHGDHEHNAGCKLFQKCLADVPGIAVESYAGWPEDPTALDGAAAIVIYSDGGGGHPAIQSNRLSQLAKAMESGAGLGCIHYAVEVPKDRGGAELLGERLHQGISLGLECDVEAGDVVVEVGRAVLSEHHLLERARAGIARSGCNWAKRPSSSTSR